MAGAARLQRSQHAEPIEDPTGLRREVLAAELVSGEGRPVEKNDPERLPRPAGSRSRPRPVRPRPRPRPRGRQPARRTPAPGRVQTPTWRNAGARCQSQAGQLGARRQARELRGRVRPPHGEGPVVARHAIPGYRVRGEPDRRPCEAPSPEVAHHEAQTHELGHPAEERDDRRLGQVMEDERAQCHVDRAGADGRLERVARDDVHLGGVGRGPRRVPEDGRVEVHGHDPHPLALAPRPSRERQRNVRRARAHVEDRGGARRVVPARRTA